MTLHKYSDCEKATISGTNYLGEKIILNKYFEYFLIWDGLLGKDSEKYDVEMKNGKT